MCKELISLSPIAGLDDFMSAGRHSCNASQAALRTTGVLSFNMAHNFSLASNTMAGQPVKSP